MNNKYDLTRIRRCVVEVQDDLDSLGIEYYKNAKLEINYRAKSRWGQAERVSGGYIIQISSTLLRSDITDEGFKETLAHEYLHTVKGCMNHGKEWTRLANLMNSAYGYHITRVSNAESKGFTKEQAAEYYKEKREQKIAKRKYAIYCDDCNAVCYYTKKSRVVQLILANEKNSGCRCCKCNGRKFTVKTL